MKIDWEAHKQQVIDDLPWNDRLVRAIHDKDKYVILSQKVKQNRTVITKILLLPQVITLEDEFFS